MQDTNLGNRAALYAALAKAQGAFQPIEKNRQVTIKPRESAAYQFRYADLEEILSKTRPALAANGLALIQTIDNTPQGSMLTCMLLHADGASLQSSLSISAARDLGDPKKFGAALTYLRRYMVTAMLGVAADDDLDDDGEGFSDAPQKPAGQKPAVAQPQRRQPEPQSEEAATQGEVAYINRKIEAAGMTVVNARERAGMTPADTLDGLTKSQFMALKVVLA